MPLIILTSRLSDSSTGRRRDCHAEAIRFSSFLNCYKCHCGQSVDNLTEYDEPAFSVTFLVGARSAGVEDEV